MSGTPIGGLTRTLAAAALLAALGAPSARAQAETGTGGGPASTITAPNTSSVGQTMPRPGSGGAGDARIEERTRQQRADDKISQGICIGCAPK